MPRPTLVFSALVCALPSFAFAAAPALAILPGPNGTFSIDVGGVLASPPEGLWSIACDWRDGWPSGWVHGSPTSRTESAGWTILRGEMAACGGSFAIEDAYRAGPRAIEARRRFQWKGAAAAPKVTLSVRFLARGGKAQALLPGILYYGNPSGAKSGRVPVWNGQPGEMAIYEEHRYPIPFAFVELNGGGRFAGAALQSVPSPVSGGNLPDQWWSLGVAGREDGAELTLLSGPCASNGQKSVIKSLQRSFTPYDSAWVKLEPGAVVEKLFYLEAFPVAREGAGFQYPVETALGLAGDFDSSGEASIVDIVRAKWAYAKTRWYQTADQAGFRKYANRDPFVMGWTGQAEAPGYALQVLAPVLQDPDAPRIAKASLDFLSSAEFYEGGFHNWYDPVKRVWSNQEILNQGQAMLNIARAIAVARKQKTDSSKWEAFFRKAADIHAARILAADWKPVSTNEAAFVAPLLMGYEMFHVDLWRAAALKAGDHYAVRHLSMREPYWGGTQDARCEDKEGAALALQAFLALYDSTKDRKYLEDARHAADVVLTYTVLWNIDLPPSRLRDHAFRTKGWTAVSPQNEHLDVWGTIVAPDIYVLGQIDGREDLKRLAILMYRTCGQMIDTAGSQGEQMQHTNYLQGSRDPNTATYRGGYNESWTVFWITAHFLTGAARFTELIR